MVYWRGRQSAILDGRHLSFQLHKKKTLLSVIVCVCMATPFAGVGGCAHFFYQKQPILFKILLLTRNRGSQWSCLLTLFVQTRPKSEKWPHTKQVGNVSKNGPAHPPMFAKDFPQHELTPTWRRSSWKLTTKSCHDTKIMILLIIFVHFFTFFFVCSPEYNWRG